MFGMSITEILFILVIVLVFLGPEKIPDAARFLGKAVREVRKASNLLRDAVMVDEESLRNMGAPPRYDRQFYDEEPEAEEVLYPRDPDPKRDLRPVTMSRRTAPIDVEEVVLAAAREHLGHREVYLHIPYEETI